MAEDLTFKVRLDADGNLKSELVGATRASEDLGKKGRRGGKRLADGLKEAAQACSPRLRG